MRELARIGIAIPDNLLEEFDRLIERRGYSSRSEAVRDLIRKEFVDEMRKGGWLVDRRGVWRWARTDRGYYRAPVRYHALISRLASSLRARMQELMLGDLTAGGDEPIPPQYQDLVDRYYRVLASERREPAAAAE